MDQGRPRWEALQGSRQKTVGARTWMCAERLGRSDTSWEWHVHIVWRHYGLVCDGLGRERAREKSR